MAGVFADKVRHVALPGGALLARAYGEGVMCCGRGFLGRVRRQPPPGSNVNGSSKTGLPLFVRL